MRVATVALCTFVLGCVYGQTPVIRWGGKSEKELQRGSIAKLLPAQLVATTVYRGPLRTARVRVWADSDYRAQNLGWQKAFDEQLEYANAVFEPMLGMHLAPEYHEWDRHAPSATLDEDLGALKTQDDGDDVVFVVGLTSALALVTPTFDQLGVALLGGRHVMLRGYATGEERAAFEELFPKVSADEREQALAARRQHKVVAVLIHELAHSLGALHEKAEDVVMSPMYSSLAASIGDKNRLIMLATLAERLATPAQRDPIGTARAELAVLEPGNDGWVDAEYASELQSLREYVGANGGAAPAPAGAPVMIAPPRLANAGPRFDAAVAHGAERYAAGDLDGALMSLRAAESAVKALPPDQAPSRWLELAGEYKAIGAIALAEDALAESAIAPPADHGIAAWAATTRAQLGIPHGALGPADEPAAVVALKTTALQLREDHLAQARPAVANLLARWPTLPGVLAARCELEFRAHTGAAARDCGAVAGSSRALFFSGVLAMQRGDHRVARDKLAAAIAMDPDRRDAYSALAKVYRDTGAHADLEALRGAYQTRFHESL
ncbi:MAG TPA: matrixin family metalloprotease [Kofleriaceae bacterium]|jgi:tetratricopeptide (TPR) repeat protein